MKMKKIMLGAAAFLLAAAMGLAGCSKEEGYRSIQVYEISGSATIERENVGSMDAYENLNLLSGDWMGVAEKSYTRLKVDDDKYLFIEEGSELSIIATGSEKDAKTNIQLEKGAVTVEVQNKLADNASFEVTTPNSVMAIRGTVVRIATDVDEKGKLITVISVLEGSASIQKIDENGVVSEEQTVDYGKEAVIYENEEKDVVIVVSNEIDMSTIPVETIEFLKEIAEERRELSVTIDEIQQMIEEKKEEQTQGNTEVVDSTENHLEENDSETNNSENTSEQGEKSPKNTETSSSENNEEDDDRDFVLIQPSVPEDSTPSDSETPDSETSDSETSDSETPDSETSDSETASPDTPAEKQTFTVTFKYQGEVFGIQTVEEGQTAAEPILRPAPTGRWNFDFNTVITADTVIEYVE